MFGYIKTDLPNMYMKDVTLYKAMYCGLCKGIGKTCGQRARMVLNYDLTFLSVLLHNLSGLDVKVEKQRCVAHQIVKRPIAVSDDLTFRIACLNVILARYKLNDDVNDEKKGRLLRAYLSKGYKRAKKKEPKLDEIVKSCYKELSDYEKTGGDSVDISADPFGKMMSLVVKELFPNGTEELYTLAYNLGKWIYLIDAIDDYEKDIKKRSFNVFVNRDATIKCKKYFLDKYKNEIFYVFSTLLSDIEKDAKTLDYKFNHDLTDNVLIRGIKVQTKNVLENNKCKNITKF